MKLKSTLFGGDVSYVLIKAQPVVLSHNDAERVHTQTGAASGVGLSEHTPSLPNPKTQV
jgi:hypothetical protein